MAWPSSRDSESFHSHVLPGAWRCSGRNNEEMVDKFVHTGIITSKEVEDAFRAVPRGAFVPPELYEEAYYDQPLRGDPHIHMSAPHMYAGVLEALDLCPGLSFLNVGSGTGYFSCLVGYIIKRNSINHGVEIRKDLVEFACERRDEFLRFSPHLMREICQPVFLLGNCFRLDPSDRKYDRIYCGSACPPSKVAFILSMTKIGGFAIIPCRNKLLKIERISPTRVKQSVLSEVCFATLLPVPEREASLPKLKFPPDNLKKQEKTLHVRPASDLLISQGQARTTLSRLRALQDACECFKTSQPIPLPFCYVPCSLHLQEMKKGKKLKSAQTAKPVQSHMCPVDSPIPFFGNSKSAGMSGSNESLLSGTEDIWDHLQSDKIWEKVLGYYYSLCSVTPQQKERTLDVYIKKKVSAGSRTAEMKRPLSYADLMQKLLQSSPSLSKTDNNAENTTNGNEASPNRNESIRKGSSYNAHMPDLGSPKASNDSQDSPEAINFDGSKNVTTDTEDGKLENMGQTSNIENGGKQRNTNIVEANNVHIVNPHLDCEGGLAHDSSICPSLEISEGTPSNNQLSNKCVRLETQNGATCPDSLEDLNSAPKFSLRSESSNGNKEQKILTDSAEGDKSDCRDISVNNGGGTVYKNVLLSVDQRHMDRLRGVTKGKWALEYDLELIRFLTDITEKSSKGRCKGWFKSELIRPELFARVDTLAYPRIGSHPPENLAFRAVTLCRIAKILDSTLYLLSGPSLSMELGTAGPKHRLESFTNFSFLSSQKSWGIPSVQEVDSPVKEGAAAIRESIVKVCYGDEKAEKMLELVRSQVELTSKKLKLTQGLQDQYKEQYKLLKKQVTLLDEKQQLVQVGRTRENIAHERMGSSESSIASELKQQRQEANGKLQKLIDLQAEQEMKKSNLLTDLKRLQEEEKRLLQPEPKLMTVSDTPGVTPACLPISYPPKALPEAATFTRKDPSAGKQPSICGIPTRYQLPALLPQLRFLLPLCRQRWRIVQELLHSTETTPPEHLPIVTVDRRLPVSERGHDQEKSVLVQVYKELRCEGLNYRWNKWKYDQWWEVKFIGEGIIDQGGGFRESLVEMTDELCPPEFGSLEVLPFFVRTANNKDAVGDYQDSYLPSPSCTEWSVYEWLGKILGALYRSDENMTLTFPPFLWKLLVGEHVTWAKDFVDVDEAAVMFTDELERMDEDLYVATYRNECKFSTVLSDGTTKELIPGGNDVTVGPADRQRFAALLREARMTESVQQVLALRRGLMSVIPESALSLITWNELERGICGNPDVSPSVLKSACKYGDDLSESSECIKFLWAALAQFTNDERSRFLRFVTGRRRPPAPFTVAKAGDGRNALPTASTCASTIYWPAYTSAAMATARLRYAVYNCVAIDTDTSPW